jgi:hypothetical protein
MDNPLPSTTGRVCQHPCEIRCRRAGVDASVNMRETHRYIGDVMYEGGGAKRVLQRILKRKKAATRRKIAVVGAGPAGLSAAFYLALLGHKVTVFDRAPNAGGLLRYALPEYRLPKKIVDKELSLIRNSARPCNWTSLQRTTTSSSSLSAHGKNRLSVFKATTQWACCPRCRFSTRVRSAKNRPSDRRSPSSVAATRRLTPRVPQNGWAPT